MTSVPSSDSDAGVTPISGLELAAGWVFGRQDPGVAPNEGGNAARAVGVLEEVISQARGEGDCFVAFSGGRDSSAVLAVATRAARERGLPDPVPVTEIYGARDADESAWQELVVRHLALQHWIRLDGGQDSDLLGPVARHLLQRHGVVWPPTVASNRRLFEEARGGVLLTGEGGDGVWAARRMRDIRRLAQAPRPSLAALRAGFRAASPRMYRKRMARREADLYWLRPHARKEAAEAIAAHVSREPLHAYRAMLHDAGSRAAIVGRNNMGVVAAEVGARLVHPLVDPRFLGALAPVIGRTGFFNVAEILAALFSDLLPAEIIHRQTKSLFNTAYFGAESQAFVHDWTGAGLDEAFVDIDALRRLWSNGRVHARTFMLLQAAWLAEHPAPLGSAVT